MITRLQLDGFKSFAHAELHLGPLSVLVGANATGKSNLRDAFRFIHGISRGYNLSEIIGEKWGEGGVLQWRGIRGGTREAVFSGHDAFAIGIKYALGDQKAQYLIKVRPGTAGGRPRIIKESLRQQDLGEFVFDADPSRSPAKPADPNHIVAAVRSGGRPRHVNLLDQRPVLTQLAERGDVPRPVKDACRTCIAALNSMRFLDLNPAKMRYPSLPGQTVLGDEGENLSSVLQAICEDEARRQVLAEWVSELTPMDASDFEFPADQTGRVLLTLVENNGQRVSAHSASDGTLRFLAMVAALLGPEPARFYFFEELDNGIHPSRLHLLLQLIEHRVGEGSIQMVATTHSPQLLALLSPHSLEHASLTYRLDGTRETRAMRIVDIPTASDVIQEHDLARLHASGWLEDAVFFNQPAEAV